MSRLQRQNTLGIFTVTPSSSQSATQNRPSPYPLHSSIANASVATTSNAVPATANAVPSSSFSHPESSSSLLSSADEEAPFASRPSDARVPVQDLGVKPNVLPREMGTLKRADLEVADTGTIKRIAQIVAVPSNLPREQMLEQIFAGRDVIPIPRKHRSLRVAATEKGIVVRTGIDKGLARPALKAIKGYNPHKEDIVAMARKEMGPQSPVPTEVGSPPPNPADLSLPEDRPTCILNKGKSVDRSVNGGDSVAASPYGRPTRVPLGRLVPADFSRPPIPTPMDSGSDYESEDDEMYAFEEVRAVEEMHEIEEVREVEEDPSRDQDTGVEYTYPPSNPESREWLEEMGSQIQSDAKELFEKASGARNEITNIVAIGILVDHDLNAVEKMYRQLSQHITRVAGPRLMRRIKERAAEIELPPFEEDSYVDENRPQAVPTGHPGQYVYDPAAGAHAQEMPMAVDNSRPSDTLSYFDRSSLPPTSPLAHALTRAKRRREQHPPSPSEYEVEGTPSPAKRRRVSNADDDDDDSFQPSHSPSCGISPEIPYNAGQYDGSPEIPYNAGVYDETAVPSSPRYSTQPGDDESVHASSLGADEGEGYNTDDEARGETDELMDYESDENDENVPPVDIPSANEDHASDSGVDLAEEYNEAAREEETSPEPSEHGAAQDAAQGENAAGATSSNAAVRGFAGAVPGAAPATPSPKRAAGNATNGPRGGIPTYVTPRDWNGKPIRRNEIPWCNGGWRSPPIT